ncbi:amidinotransferase [Candidatus Bathyarchaeota archaeon]|nr:amidinotransferase [Candidatus Bathyarchaeota archaeon]MBS7630189.1 amidinotransferase [Candidatus Bathyarchaeota archaeon]
MSDNAPKHALVRQPGDRYRSCISSHPLRHLVDLNLARKQHEEYCQTLRELGLEVITLPRDDMHPDSCFVEDNAVIHKGRALICRMAKDSRRGEEEAVMEFLKTYMPVKKAEYPATVEGGDVVHLPDRLISGVTERTNMDGVKQIREWLNVRVDVIENPKIVHLKSYITYLGKRTVIATEDYAKHPALEDLKVIVVPKEEAYAANTLAIGDIVLMPGKCPHAHELVHGAGFEVRPIEVSEFEKCEGAITCLSLLF